MNSYPPFFKIDDDINNLIYYTFEFPNYFKLFDFINAIVFVFEIKNLHSTKFDIWNIFSVIKSDSANGINKINNQVSNQVPNQVSNQVPNQVANQVPNRVPNQVPNRVTKQIANQVANQVTKQIDNQVTKQIDNQVANQVQIPINDDNISKISINDITQSNKKLYNNNNAFIELNIENSDNYALITDMNNN